MAQIIYAKYNKLRRREFRVRTCILEDDESRWVEKRALCPEAREHVSRMIERLEQLEEVYPQMDFVPARAIDDGGVRFDYLTGEAVDGLLASRVSSAEDLKNGLTELFARIFPALEKRAPFQLTPAFREVFGQGTGLEGLEAAALVNVDCLLENLLVKDGRLVCLDYEWVFDFAVPLDYIRYRVVNYFYRSHPETARLIGGNELLAGFGLTTLDCAIYAAMELEFQRYVFGKEEDCRYTENYRKPVLEFDQMLADKAQTERENEELRKVVGHYEGIERKLRKIGLWQCMQGVQKAGRKIKSLFGKQSIQGGDE